MNLKFYGEKTFLATFLGFLLFQISLVVTLGVLMFAVFSLAEVFVNGKGAEDSLEGLFLALAIYIILALVILCLSPFWGKRIIGRFTGTAPSYLPIAVFAVWIPLVLSIIANAATEALLGESNDLSSALILFSQIIIIAIVSSLYHKRYK